MTGAPRQKWTTGQLRAEFQVIGFFARFPSAQTERRRHLVVLPD